MSPPTLLLQKYVLIIRKKSIFSNRHRGNFAFRIEQLFNFTLQKPAIHKPLSRQTLENIYSTFKQRHFLRCSGHAVFLLSNLNVKKNKQAKCWKRERVNSSRETQKSLLSNRVDRARADSHSFQSKADRRNKGSLAVHWGIAFSSEQWRSI